ncbi:hypothetical protein ACFQAT_13735 [Undibacterium arcticum]
MKKFKIPENTFNAGRRGVIRASAGTALAFGAAAVTGLVHWRSRKQDAK